MKFIKVFALFIAVILFSSLKAQQQGIFFKITGKNISNPSYLFATAENAAPILFNPGDSLFMALNSTKRVATMLILDSVQRQELHQLMLLPENRTYLSYVNNMKFGIVDEQFYMADGSSLWSFNNYYPLFIQKKLAEAKAGGTGASFEKFLVMLAQEQGKTVTPYYSPAQLHQLYSKIPVVLQTDILVEYASNMKNDLQKEQKLNFYLNGNTSRIFNMAKERQHYEFIRQINRQYAADIANQIKVLGQQQPTFFIADASLLGGEGGITDLLLKAGYQLTPIQAYMQPGGVVQEVDQQSENNDSLQFYSLNNSYPEAYFKEVIPNWVTTVSHQGAFLVRMPEEPTVAVDRVSAEKENITINTYKSEDRAINTFYMVSYYDYPDGFNPDTKKDFFKDVISKVVRRMGGSLLMEKNISTDEYKGREIEVAVDEDYFVRAKFYLVGNRLYQLIIGAADRRAYSPENEAYLNSFRLIKQRNVGWYDLNLGAVHVQLPNEPVRDKNVTSSNGKDVISYTYKAVEENSGLNYLVSYTLYPEEMNIMDINSFYNSLTYKAAEAINGILIKEEDVKSSSGIKGRYFEIGAKSGNVYRIYLYYTNNRLFQIMLEGTEDTAYSTFAKIFVDGYSFSELEY